MIGLQKCPNCVRGLSNNRFSNASIRRHASRLHVRRCAGAPFQPTSPGTPGHGVAAPGVRACAPAPASRSGSPRTLNV